MENRRVRMTKQLIKEAFLELLEQMPLEKLTVTHICRAADVNRSTFYAHFETKDDLLKALCEELFGHIIDTAKGLPHGQYHYTCGSQADSVFLHLLRHLQENDSNVLGLLSGESSEMFLRYFKDSLNELIQSQVVGPNRQGDGRLPEDFLVNHISGSFVEMVLWWIKGKMRQSPAELDRYFRAVIEPVL